MRVRSCLGVLMPALAILLGTVPAGATWTISTFNAENLNGHGAGNQALWCGVNNATLASPPGYGNDWDYSAMWVRTMVNPGFSQTVQLSFAFNYDTEPSYDFFRVEYDRAGTWVTIFTIDGTNKSSGTFAAPGVQYPTDVTTADIFYAGGDYGGTGGDQIRIRLRFSSDGAWSDADGLWDTDGAVQVDDVVIVWDDGGKSTNFEFYDFEGPHDWVLAPTVAPTGCALEMAPADSTTTSGTLGYWFTAPADFVIDGVQAPLELGGDPQSFQIVRIDTDPVNFASPASTTDFVTLVHLANQPGGVLVDLPDIQIYEGDRIGVLGGTTQDGTSTRSSLTAYLPGPFISKISGLSNPLYRLATSESVTSGPASSISYSPYGEMGRLQLFLADCDSLVQCACEHQWRLRNSKGPSRRAGAGMAYDGGQEMTLLFGGHDGVSFLGDTWLWNGTKWTQLLPATSPPARSGPGMVYDSDRGVIVLFGGYSPSGILQDTWEWNGTTWTPSPAPPTGPIATMGMAYDPLAQVVVRYGGDSGAGTARDTYEYDGSVWNHITNNSPPGYRGNHAMVFSPQLGKTLMFGGHAPGGVPLDDTWTYDAITNTWTQVATPGPSPRRLHAMVYDPSCKAVRLYGGSYDNQAIADHWLFDGATWQQDPSTIPTLLGPRELHNMVYDTRSDHLLLFGGRADGRYENYTWAYDCWGSTDFEEPHGGVLHVTIGDAHLLRAGLTGLIVSNIGDSGDDGVAVAYGETRGFQMCFDPPLGEVLSPPKDSVTFDEVSATNNEVEDEQFLAFGGTNDGSDWSFEIDFTGLGASGYTVEVHDDNGLVSSQSGFPNGSQQVLLPASIGAIGTLIDENDDYCKYVDVHGGAPVSIVVGGQPSTGNRVVFKPDAPSVATTYLTGTTLTTNAAETITECWPSMFLGEVSVMGVGNALVTGENHGAGLRLRLPESFDPGVLASGVDLAWKPEGGCDQGVSIGWDPIVVADLEVGDAWTLRATGEMDAVAHSPLGSLELELIDKSTGNPTFQCLADYGDVGSSTQRIQVFDGPALVADFSGHSGAFTVQMPSPPDGCGKELVDLDGWGTACYRIVLASPGTLTLDGIAGTKAPVVVTGDEIAVLAEEPSGTLTRLQSFSVLASPGFPDVVITSMTGASGSTAVGSTPTFRFAVERPFPNPFNPQVEIRFVNPRRGPVSVDVYDVAGRRVRQLVPGDVLDAGAHVLHWNGRDGRGAAVASGVYLVRVRSAGHEQTVKATLLK